MLIDSHCHLDFPDFDEDRDAVIARAEDEGVQKIISIATRHRAFAFLKTLIESQRTVYGAVGIHPLNVKSEEPATLTGLLKAADHPKIVAIGETGLDHHYDQESHAQQVESLEVHIEAARQSGLPLVIHARDVDAPLSECLEAAYKRGAFKAVMHCYASGAKLAEVALRLGFFISFSGIITFKNAEALRRIARDVPIERLLVETDAPFLAPTPNRGKRNEPAYVRHTALALAALRGLEPDEMIARTGDNAMRLFTKLADV